MNKIKIFLPSFVTSLNMLSGVCASVFALNGNLKVAVALIMAASIFDFCDGLVARLLHTVSEFGKQLDSLSDLISFGLAPSFILYNYSVTNGIFSSYTGLFILLIAVFSGLRLAKFNIDPEQSVEFKGLPTPASALFIISLCYYCSQNTDFISNLFLHQASIIIVVFILCFLMISNIKLLSLKIKSLKIKAIFWQLILLFTAILLIAFFNFFGITLAMIFYVILSFIKQHIKTENR